MAKTCFCFGTGSYELNEVMSALVSTVILNVISLLWAYSISTHSAT